MLLTRWIPQILMMATIATVSLALVQNWDSLTSVTLGIIQWPQLSLGLIILLSFALGVITPLFRLWTLIRQLSGSLQYAQLIREKSDVAAQTASDQVRVLEAKIQTLETALQKALSQSSKTP